MLKQVFITPDSVVTPCQDPRVIELDLYFREDPEDRAAAAAICMSCPSAVLRACGEWAEAAVAAGVELDGVWAGRDHRPAPARVIGRPRSR